MRPGAGDDSDGEDDNDNGGPPLGVYDRFDLCKWSIGAYQCVHVLLELLPIPSCPRLIIIPVENQPL